MQMTFNTHSLVKRLVKAEFTEKQAEEVINIITEVRQSDLDVLATKRDIGDIKTEMREYFYKTVIALGSITVAVVGIGVAIISIFK